MTTYHNFSIKKKDGQKLVLRCLTGAYKSTHRDFTITLFTVERDVSTSTFPKVRNTATVSTGQYSCHAYMVLFSIKKPQKDLHKLLVLMYVPKINITPKKVREWI